MPTSAIGSCAAASASKRARSADGAIGAAWFSPSIERAMAAGVGSWKNRLVDSRRGLAACSSASTLSTRSESPPRSKKLSARPARSRPSTRSKAAQTRRSVSVRPSSKGSPSSGRAASGAGRARRSILPLGERGSVASVTNTAGTM